jgi:hypothetical protein
VKPAYLDTVRLLLAVAPTVFEPARFALKGGTALNLFVDDMPRISVDIDVVFTDHTLEREAALEAISAELRQIKSRLTTLRYRTELPATRAGDEVKLLIEPRRSPLKVEVNSILRGTLLPVSRRRLTPRARELFTTDLELPVLATPELYGGKLVAAMDRQHPRDMFDVERMLSASAWRPEIIDCFVAYLAGHNRPVHEVLFPHAKPLEPAFSSEFAGMTTDPIELAALQATQRRLLQELPYALTPSHREFLLSLVRAGPAWDLAPFPILRELPALKWKLVNLRKLKARSAERFEAQVTALADHFARL